MLLEAFSVLDSLLTVVLQWSRRLQGWFEFFKAVNVWVEVFWAVTPCNIVVSCRCFRGPCCIYL